MVVLTGRSVSVVGEVSVFVDRGVFIIVGQEVCSSWEFSHRSNYRLQCHMWNHVNMMALKILAALRELQCHREQNSG